jgi:hypothetical protein
MGDEHLEVLRMVAEKKISVEEAERLLRAIDDGERARKGEGAERSDAPGSFRIAEILKEVGSMVQGVVEEAASGIGAAFGEECPAGHQEVVLEDGRFTVPASTQLVVRQRRWHGKGDIELVPGEGETCTISGGGEKVRVFRGPDRIEVILGGGAAKLAVPPTVSGLKAVLMGGAIRTEGLACQLDLKTMGGDMKLGGIRNRFDVKTMGGGLRLDLDPGLTGESRAVTMGGDIQVQVPRELRATFRAVTMGGDFDVDPELGSPVFERKRAYTKAVLEMGEAGNGQRANLKVKTMGGRIALRKKG